MASQIKLGLYRLVVRVEEPLGSGKYEIVNYWVNAPTQCSASKHTMLREEIDDIILVELWSKAMPAEATITFTTEKNCP
jgi:hypothetical protein